jgi:hypothetical protein
MLHLISADGDHPLESQPSCSEVQSLAEYLGKTRQKVDLKVAVDFQGAIEDIGRV